jgi:diguanylate cyclase (GGDEF)-like protein
VSHGERDTDRATILSHSDPNSGNHPPRLVVVGGALLGLQVVLTDETVIIGRAGECGLCLPHPSVSRQHCKVTFVGGRYFIEDLGSTNRTLLNGHAVAHAELKDGDHIAIGNHGIKFFRGNSPEARYHHELIELAIYDSLTGFLNRRQFLGKLSEELESCLSQQQPISLLLIDIDHFKRINDQYGHLTGDHVLSELAKLLRQQNLGELVGRIGGEEFAIALPEIEWVQAKQAANRLRENVFAQRFEHRGELVPVTVSIGVCEYQARFEQDLKPWMAAADSALYAAKNGGRNRVEVFQTE